MKHLLFALFVIAGCGGRTDGRPPVWSGETGFLDRTVTLDSTRHRYQVYVPSDYAPDRAWPVILFLHGAGERGDNGMAQTHVGLGKALRFDPARWPAIVVFPQLPAGENWHPGTEPLAMRALDQTLAEFMTDPDRIFLTGLSMGGYGSLFLSGRHPDRFAALALICPSVGRYRGYPLLRGTDLPSAITEVAQSIRHLPVWLFHGDQDTVFPVSMSRSLYRSLDSLGADVRFTEYAQTGHNAWDAAYADTALIEWLFAQRRDAP